MKKLWERFPISKDHNFAVAILKAQRPVLDEMTEGKSVALHRDINGPSLPMNSGIWDCYPTEREISPSFFGWH